MEGPVVWHGVCWRGKELTSVIMDLSGIYRLHWNDLGTPVWTLAGCKQKNHFSWARNSGRLWKSMVDSMSITVRGHYSCGEERPVRKCSEGLTLSPALFSSAFSFESVGNMGLAYIFICVSYKNLIFISVRYCLFDPSEFESSLGNPSPPILAGRKCHLYPLITFIGFLF